MKIISDIRLYKSSKPGERTSFAEKAPVVAVRRLAMKLRESGFSLGNFDHLYLVFSCNIPEGEISLFDNSDRFHPWYRYCELGISPAKYELLDSPEAAIYVLEQAGKALLKLFNDSASQESIIKKAVSEASKGQEMLIRLKEKKTIALSAAIYLRLLDSGAYQPQLCVTNSENVEILRKALPICMDLSSIGDIQLSSRKVSVKARKNACVGDFQPVCFEL